MTPSRSYCCWSTKYSPAFATLTVRGLMFPSTCGSGLKMPGRSTGRSRSSCGATTMKMMSSTSTTSTSGVTFISGATPAVRTRLRHPLTPDPLPVLLLGLVPLDLRFRPPLDVVEQLPRRGVQRRLVAGDLRREVVEGEHGGDGGGEPGGGLAG